MSTDMFPDGFWEYMRDHEEEFAVTEKCMECGKDVTIQIMKNTGLCSENCRKAFTGETAKSNAQVDAGITNILAQPRGEVNLRGIE